MPQDSLHDSSVSRREEGTCTPSDDGERVRVRVLSDVEELRLVSREGLERRAEHDVLPCNSSIPAVRGKRRLDTTKHSQDNRWGRQGEYAHSRPAVS